MSLSFTKLLQSVHQLDNGELNTVIEHIKARRAELASRNRLTFKVGDTVTFSGRGKSHVGKIEAIKVKNAVVREGNINWRVPLNLLASAA
jgi:hypothetical protein